MVHHDPAGPSAPFLRAPPFWLGPYLIVDRLGRGGMGDVFLARHTASVGEVEKLCVLKAIRQDIADAEYIQRFFDEARMLFRLAHRNICPVFEVGEVDGGLFISMAYVAGLNLTELVAALQAQGERLPPALAVGIVGEILEALDYAHRLEDPATGLPLGIVHRDVSPQNVMLSLEGEVRLIDFGLAKSHLNREQTAQNVIFGKMRYMAPEHAQGHALDGRADQFASAILLYELLAHRRFYEGVKSAELPPLVAAGSHRPADLRSLDPALVPILERALSPSPADRFDDCGALLDALLGVMASRGWRAGTRDIRRLLKPHLAKARTEHRLRLKHVMNLNPAAPKVEEATHVHVALSSLGPSSSEDPRTELSDRSPVPDLDDSGPPTSLRTQTATALVAPEPPTEEASEEHRPIFNVSTQEPLPAEFGKDPTLLAPRPVSMNLDAGRVASGGRAAVKLPHASPHRVAGFVPRVEAPQISPPGPQIHEERTEPPLSATSRTEAPGAPARPDLANKASLRRGSTDPRAEPQKARLPVSDPAISSKEETAGRGPTAREAAQPTGRATGPKADEDQLHTRPTAEREAVAAHLADPADAADDLHDTETFDPRVLEQSETRLSPPPTSGEDDRTAEAMPQPEGSSEGSAGADPTGPRDPAASGGSADTDPADPPEETLRVRRVDQPEGAVRRRRLKQMLWAAALTFLLCGLLAAAALRWVGTSPGPTQTSAALAGSTSTLDD